MSVHLSTLRQIAEQLDKQAEEARENYRRAVNEAANAKAAFQIGEKVKIVSQYAWQDNRFYQIRSIEGVYHPSTDKLSVFYHCDKLNKDLSVNKRDNGRFLGQSEIVRIGGDK